MHVLPRLDAQLHRLVRGLRPFLGGDFVVLCCSYCRGGGSPVLCVYIIACNQFSQQKELDASPEAPTLTQRRINTGVIPILLFLLATGTVLCKAAID